MERSSASRAERQTSPLEQAYEALRWLPNYMHGWTDTVEELPYLAKERLVILFGSDEVEDHLARLRMVFTKIPAEHQVNVGLFTAGYPDEAVAELSDIPIDQTLIVLRQLMELETPVEPADEKSGRRLSLPLRVLQSLPDTDDEQHRQTRQLDFMTTREGLEWQDDALCSQTDPEVFFPEKGGSTRDAKKVCDSCQVRSSCLEHALLNNERFGIWGGLSERERRRLSGRMKRAAPSSE